MDFSLYYTPDYLQELAKKIRMPEAAAKAVLEQMSSLDLDTVNTLCSLLTDASVSFHEKADKIQQISSTPVSYTHLVLSEDGKIPQRRILYHGLPV